MVILNDYRIRFEKSLAWRVSAFLLDTFGFPLSIPNKLLGTGNLNSNPKILTIRKDEIGDAVLSLPIYEAIKKKYPKSKITVLASKYTEEVFRNNPYIDELLLTDPFWKKGIINYIKGLLETSRIIRNKKFDIGIDPKGSIINIILMYLGRVRKRISYWNISGGRYLLTNPVFYEKQIHEVESNLNLLRIIGIKTKFIIPKLYLTEKERKDVKSYLKKNRLSDFVAVYAIPSQTYKKWDNEKFSELIKSFPKKIFVIIGTSMDRKDIEEITNNNDNVLPLYDFNIRKLSYLFGFAKAVVAVDGGPMHLAWISNKNVISLFGQNDLKLWKPLNKGIAISHLPDSEQGIFRKKLELNQKNKYMEMIKVEEVKRELRKKI